MSRKIIQIAIDKDGFIIALCDDGTVWKEMENGVINSGEPLGTTYITHEWAKICPVPQYPIEEFCDSTLDQS